MKRSIILRVMLLVAIAALSCVILTLLNMSLLIVIPIVLILAIILGIDLYRIYDKQKRAKAIVTNIQKPSSKPSNADAILKWVDARNKKKL